MKKVGMTILSVGLLLSIAACKTGGKTPTPTSEASAAPEVSVPSETHTPSNLEEKTITGKISDIKNVMFILDDGKEAYVFSMDENFKLEGIKDGDQVKVTYTGELSVTGDTEYTLVNVEKSN